MIGNEVYRSFEALLKDQLNQLIERFHSGADDAEAINQLLTALMLVSPAPHVDVKDTNPVLFYELHSAIFDYLDYLDAESSTQCDFILDNVDDAISGARLAFSPPKESYSSKEPDPKGASSRLRFALCAATIHYRENDFAKGLEILSRVGGVVNPEMQRFRDKVSPHLDAQRFFLEAKIRVRRGEYELAEELFANAISAYEAWELRKEREAVDPTIGLSPNFRNFVTYKICVTQAFYAYSLILQDRFGKVTRDILALERLLDYSNHRKTKNFVKIVRARAMRLTGFENPERLNHALKILRDCREELGEEVNHIDLNQELIKQNKVRFLQYYRHTLMGLFQEGLVLFYLYTSSVDNSNQVVAGDNRDGILEELEKVIDEIETVNNARPHISPYWLTRSNTLRTYLYICQKKFDEARRLGDENEGVEVADMIARAEALISRAEAHIAYTRSLERESLERIEALESVRSSVHQCSSDRKDITKGSIKGRIFLLEAEAAVLDGRREEAEIAWKKWEDISGMIENSRWQTIALRVKEEIDYMGDRFVYPLNNNFVFKDATNVFKDAQEELERWVYTQAKRNFKTDLKRIKHLKVSKFKFYDWKKKFDKKK